jgi:hypothetical protein
VFMMTGRVGESVGEWEGNRGLGRGFGFRVGYVS